MKTKQHSLRLHLFIATSLVFGLLPSLGAAAEPAFRDGELSETYIFSGLNVHEVDSIIRCEWANDNRTAYPYFSTHGGLAVEFFSGLLTWHFKTTLRYNDKTKIYEEVQNCPNQRKEPTHSRTYAASALDKWHRTVDAVSNWTKEVLLADVKQKMALNRLSDDGTQIEGQLTVTSAAISKNFVQPELTAKFLLTLQECRDGHGRTIYNSFESSPLRLTSSAREIVLSLRKNSREKIQSCELRMSTPYTADFVRNGHLTATESARFRANVNTPHQLFLLIDKGLNGTFNGEFFLQKQNAEIEGERLALTAHADLQKLLTDDYGDFLYQLTEKTLSPTEREEAIRAYFELKAPLILSLFETIDQNYGHLNLMTKISMLIQMKRTYVLIGKLETMANVSPKLSLDSVIQR